MSSLRKTGINAKWKSNYINNVPLCAPLFSTNNPSISDIEWARCWQVRVQKASAANPGIPPSSLMTFLRANQSIAGVVLADFNSGFHNPYFQSHWDGPAEIRAQSIAAAAHVTALALSSLAAGSYSGPLQVTFPMDAVRRTLPLPPPPLPPPPLPPTLHSIALSSEV